MFTHFIFNIKKSIFVKIPSAKKGFIYNLLFNNSITIYQNMKRKKPNILLYTLQFISGRYL